MAGEHLFLLSDPRHIRDVLVTHQRSFVKGRGLERARRLLGDGLLTSEGATHLRQRRLMQPAFHRDRIAAYAAVMTGYADRIGTSWTDGSDIDVAREMMRLTLAIVGKTLFDTDVEAHAPEVGAALTAVMESFWTMMLPFSDLLERLPVPRLRRARAARAELDAIIYGMIAERRRSPGDRGDLLSMLLVAQDEEDGHDQPGPRHDRRAGPRRGDDDLPRRPRDDGERADLDLVSAEPGARRRGPAARGGRSGARRPAPRPWRTSPRSPSSNRS